MRLALIEDEPTRLTQRLERPLERALRAAGTYAALESVSEVSCSFAGRDHQFVLPAGSAAPEGAGAALALESESEVAFVYPANQDLADAITAAAADPATYRRPYSASLSPHDAQAATARLDGGGTLLTVRALLDQPASGRWRTALAAHYRLRWKGALEDVFVLSRTYGGLGRLAAAEEREAENGPLVGVARGGTFGSPASDASGRAELGALEKAGLKYTAVSGSELEHWKDLADYRRERPDGVAFLSANIFYSTAAAAAAVGASSATIASTSAATALPPYAVFEASGTRVALVGLTPAWAGKLLSQVGISGLTVADPVSTLESLIPRLRREADVVIALGDLGASDEARLAGSVRGLDLLIADEAPFLITSPPPATTIRQDDRPAFANPLPPVRAYAPALNVVEIDRRADDDLADWTVTQSAILLDDAISPLPGYPEPALETFAAGRSTEPAVLPAARAVFPPAERGGQPSYADRDFWTLTAALLAQRSDSEAGLLLDAPLPVQTVGPVPESLVRAWLAGGGYAVRARVPGTLLKKLQAESLEQRRREAGDLPPTGRPRFVVSGLDAKGRVRGAPLDPTDSYLVATSRAAADALGLPQPYEAIAGTPTVAGLALDELRTRVGASTSTWRDWMSGSSLEQPGLWRVNFRDISLNIRDTKTYARSDFANVINSRVQGGDELYVGGDLKTDVDYLRDDYKWTNTVEMAYSRDRVAPNGQPAATNVTDDRIMLLTLGTEKVGTTPVHWLAQSWGPSIGAEYDTQFQPLPGLPLANVAKVFPGLEFYDGSVFKTIELSGVAKRDMSRIPPNTQLGAHARAVLSTPLGSRGAHLDAEFWNNYYVLTRTDNSSDLRIEGDVNAKLSIPIRKYLSVAPFVDFSWFQLKIQPTWGYSLMTGVSIGFSRLWKPQYESF
ncbi:MAG: hypothetical protein HKL90_07535 [Elusimicrobia bacterium]|nr:hypothetical protein [Elusimicrobiota bacterium]